MLIQGRDIRENSLDISAGSVEPIKRQEVMEMEERDDVIVLIDENGEEVEFEHLDTIEMNGNEYVVLVLIPGDDEDISDEDSEEVLILKIEHGENDEDSFVSVDDEDELNLVFEEFKSRMEDDFEFEDK